MKKRFLGSLVVLVLVFLAFMIGRWVEGARNGYHFEVLEEKEIASTPKPIRWKSVAEHVGLPVIDTDSTLIEVDGRLIYKAKRAFQETHPFARNVTVNGGLIEWDDGEYSYSLRMQELPSGGPITRPGMAPTESRPPT